MKSKDFLNEKWSRKYKRSINCSSPKGFSQRAHCAGRKKNESVELDEIDRRGFLKGLGAAALAGAGGAAMAGDLEGQIGPLPIMATIKVQMPDGTIKVKKIDLGHEYDYRMDDAKKEIEQILNRKGVKNYTIHLDRYKDNEAYLDREQMKQQPAAKPADKNDYMDRKPYQPKGGSGNYVDNAPLSPKAGSKHNYMDPANYEESLDVAEGSAGAKYKIKSIGKDKNGDYYISPNTGKKVYKQAKVGDHETPRGEVKPKVTEGSLEEYGDTARGQKQLTRVHKRAVDRLIKADDKNMLEPDYTKRDLKTVRKNQATADRAWERMSDKGVAEGSEDDIEDTRQFRNAIALAKSQKAIRQAKDGKGAKHYADGTKVTPDEVARRAAERKAKKQGVAEADAELAEPPERPRKTTTKTKPDIKFDIPFQQDQDRPLAKTDPLDDIKKKAGIGDEPKVNIKKAKQKDTLSKTAGIGSDDMADMLGKLRNIEVDRDLEAYPEPEPPEQLPSVEVNTANLPAVAGQALQAAGVQNPDFHQVANLPGNMADQIRQLGKSLFGSLTMTPTKRIHVVANLGGQGPNSSAEVNAVAGFLKDHGKDLGPGDIDFERVMPGYKAQTHMFSAAGIRWMLVKDFAGQYIYCWPEEDSHDAVDVIGQDTDTKKLR